MKVMDKASIELRKQSWPEIMERLKEYGCSRGHMKIMEAYYLKGKDPKWSDDGWEEDPIPLVFRLWLHPDQSDESWCEITEKVLAYRRRSLTGISIKDGRRIINSCALSHYYNGVDAPLSFFCGAEERLFRFMYWGSESGRRYMYNPRPKYPEENDYLYSPPSFGSWYYVDMSLWLGVELPEVGIVRSPTPNPYYLGRYLTELWRQYLENATEEDVEKIRADERYTKIIKGYFAVVAQYPKSVDGDDYGRCEHCHEVRNILDGANVPPLIKQWWEVAKS